MWITYPPGGDITRVDPSELGLTWRSPARHVHRQGGGPDPAHLNLAVDGPHEPHGADLDRDHRLRRGVPAFDHSHALAAVRAGRALAALEPAEASGRHRL